MPSDFRPRFTGCHVLPASSVLNAPAAEMAMKMRSGLLGSRMIVCRHMPPAPGCHFGPDPCLRNPESSSQFCAPSFEMKSAASSIPAYTVSASVSDGSRCHTLLNSHGCAVPSYHWCVPGTPSYKNLFPPGSQVFPPSFERWICCPNHPLLCDAYKRLGSTGDPFT